MSIHFPTLMVIIGCAVVTAIPRLLPFLIIRNMKLPEPVLKWLSYIPICILTALVTESFIVQTEHSLVFDWPVIAVLIPTFLLAVWTRSLFITVIAGIVLMAAFRFFIH